MKKYVIAIPIVLLVALASLFIYFSDSIRGVVPLIEPVPELPNNGEVMPFEVPEGFRATLYSKDTPGARVITRDPRGVMTVSLTNEGRVVLLPDEDGNSVADAVIDLITNLQAPHGIVFDCPSNGNTCTLYVAEETAVTAYEYNPENRTTTLEKTVMTLPSDGGHSTRTLHMHPDGRHLLVSTGSSCNVCDEKDPLRAAIYSIDLETYTSLRFAWGLRNTVFMATHPVTGDIWGSDMGRDLLGDDIPPDEINILRDGSWYGWPWFYGKSVFDERYEPGVEPSFAYDAVGSHIDIPAHSAPLGIAFVPEEGWPEEYWHDLIIAYHGSWNRSEPTGYKLVRFDLTPEGELDGIQTDFMTGFFNAEGKLLGRPAGLMIEPGGTLYVSDDRAGAIYKISRTSEEM